MIDLSLLTFSTEWLPDDHEWVALCEQLPSLSAIDKDRTWAMASMLRLAADMLDDMAQD